MRSISTYLLDSWVKTKSNADAYSSTSSSPFLIMICEEHDNPSTSLINHCNDPPPPPPPYLQSEDSMPFLTSDTEKSDTDSLSSSIEIVVKFEAVSNRCTTKSEKLQLTFPYFFLLRWSAE